MGLAGVFRRKAGQTMGRFPLVEKEIVSEEKDKPVLDEQTLGKLLEAAYVLQEHNREMHEMELGLSLKRDQIEAEERATPPHAAQKQSSEPPADADYTFTLAKIVETQHQIQVRHLDLGSAMSLISERLVPIARASGAAIGILDGKRFHYRAVAGLLTLPADTDVVMDKALCLACLRTGQVFRCMDVNPEFLLDTDECRRRGIQSLIAVPVFHNGDVVGGLELYYPTTQAFTEHDVHSCQLMAGLVTEALSRDEEVARKKSIATERAVMLEALEKLKPIAALIDKSGTKDSALKSGTAAKSASSVACRKCGHHLVGEEQFCGKCGTPRSGNYEAPSMQSKVATLWHMQEAMKNSEPGMATLAQNLHLPVPAPGASAQASGAKILPAEKSLADSLEEQVPELFEATGRSNKESNKEKTDSPSSDDALISAEFEDSILADLEIPPKGSSRHSANSEDEHDLDEVGGDEVASSPSTALVKPERPTAWSSAASARDFLEQMMPAQEPGAMARFWNARRGDVYLGIAVLLVACVIRWGILPNHSVGATGRPATGAAQSKPAPDADLSLFDRMLISLGLADPPPAPEYHGNPATQVWVDLQTALYYCPGADLYGKTPKGKFTSQRDAQLDQFEPAYRKTCD
jgi:ribosomal protein L37E